MAWIDALFKRMVELGASDLHMTAGKKPSWRLHGEMMHVDECAVIKTDQMRQILMEITPPANKAEFESDNDTDFAYAIKGLARFRVNLFVDRSGPGAVFRQIPEEIMTAEQLGLPDAVVEFCQLSKGLVLVTGPTGSGKSTTLAAMVDHINKTRCEHIITIEDPIEFVHKDNKCLINQREVGNHTESFKRALRAALREDPDIVLVGEMRDLETIEIAIETAETGHLVFGTLHTTTAASTVDRVIDSFPADRQAQIRTMLSTSLKGVVAQVLCKKIGGGRIAALEVLVVNSAISAIIREGKTHQIPSNMQMGGKRGMKLLNYSLLELVKKGLVEPQEAYLKSVDKQGLASSMKVNGIILEGVEVEDLTMPGGPGAPPQPNAPLPAGGAPLPPPQQQQQQQQQPGGEYEVDPFEAYKQQQGR
ncbi:MAG: type IV pilus twitching motility protein PilT [Planctomycetota bacterium]